MHTTNKGPIQRERTTNGSRLASASEVSLKLGSFRVSELDAHITPFLAAAGAELASVAGISWRLSTDDAPVALLRLIARAAIVAPQAAGPHTQRLAEQLDERRG